jgi:hypothetical protein
MVAVIYRTNFRIGHDHSATYQMQSRVLFSHIIKDIIYTNGVGTSNSAMLWLSLSLMDIIGDWRRKAIYDENSSALNVTVRRYSGVA